MGYSKEEAALKGTREIAGAVTSSTLTSVVVFLPIAFLEGFAAQIFRELALTVSFSLIASLVVSLTVVPLLCSRALSENTVFGVSEDKKGPIARLSRLNEKAIRSVTDFYQKSLDWAVRRKKTVVFGAIAVFVGSMTLLPFVGTELIPSSDEGQINVSLTLPQGASLAQTNDMAAKVEEIAGNYPDVEKVSTSVGGTEASANSASITLVLKDKKDREHKTSEVAESIRKDAAKLAGAKISVEESNSMFGSMSMGGSGLSVIIRGKDEDVLREISQKTEEAVKKIPGTREVASSFSSGRPEMQIVVDREKAAHYNLTGYQVASAIRLATEGNVVTRYKEGGTEIDVRLKFPDDETDTLEKIRDITIATPTGAAVLLDYLVTMEKVEGMASVDRNNRQRSVTVTTQIFGRDMGNVSADLQKTIDGIALPEGYSFELGGQYEMMTDTFSALFLALLLSVILVYMVMAGQFESFINPFIIMFSIPLAFTGSSLILFLTGKTLNVASLIGVIVLVGIVVNNAIVLIDYIGQLRNEGMEMKEAVLKAGPTRLRPILMTALTTILGLLPLFVSTSQGAEMQSSMAAVVMGGLLTSTVLTLIFIPVLYLVVHERMARRKEKRRQKKLASQTV